MSDSRELRGNFVNPEESLVCGNLSWASKENRRSAKVTLHMVITTDDSSGESSLIVQPTNNHGGSDLHCKRAIKKIDEACQLAGIECSRGQEGNVIIIPVENTSFGVQVGNNSKKDDVFSGNRQYKPIKCMKYTPEIAKALGWEGKLRDPETGNIGNGHILLSNEKVPPYESAQLQPTFVNISLLEANRDLEQSSQVYSRAR